MTDAQVRQMHRMAKAKTPVTEIARELGCDERTVRRYLKGDRKPSDRAGPGAPCKVQPVAGCLGCVSTRRLIQFGRTDDGTECPVCREAVWK